MSEKGLGSGPKILPAKFHQRSHQKPFSNVLSIFLSHILITLKDPFNLLVDGGIGWELLHPPKRHLAQPQMQTNSGKMGSIIHIMEVTPHVQRKLAKIGPLRSRNRQITVYAWGKSKTSKTTKVVSSRHSQHQYPCALYCQKNALCTEMHANTLCMIAQTTGGLWSKIAKQYLGSQRL